MRESEWKDVENGSTELMDVISEKEMTFPLFFVNGLEAKLCFGITINVNRKKTMVIWLDKNT